MTNSKYRRLVATLFFSLNHLQSLGLCIYQWFSSVQMFYWRMLDELVQIFNMHIYIYFFLKLAVIKSTGPIFKIPKMLHTSWHFSVRSDSFLKNKRRIGLADGCIYPSKIWAYLSIRVFFMFTISYYFRIMMKTAALCNTYGIHVVTRKITLFLRNRITSLIFDLLRFYNRKY